MFLRTMTFPTGTGVCRFVLLFVCVTASLQVLLPWLLPWLLSAVLSRRTRLTARLLVWQVKKEQ